MFICTALMAVYYVKRRKSVTKDSMPPTGAVAPGEVSLSRDIATEAEAARARKFVIAMSVAYVAVLLRCCYR